MAKGKAAQKKQSTPVAPVAAMTLKPAQMRKLEKLTAQIGRTYEELKQLMAEFGAPRSKPQAAAAKKRPKTMAAGAAPAA